MRLYNNEEEERTTRHETSEISKAKLFREKKKKKNLPKMLTDDTRPIKRWTVYVSPQQQRSPIFPSILLR